MTLRHAVDVQRGMAGRNVDIPEERRIAFRIAINLGDVVAHEGVLLGAGVDISARLEGLAEPGGICLSRAALDDMGEVEVKNIARPVRVFRVLMNDEVPVRGR